MVPSIPFHLRTSRLWDWINVKSRALWTAARIRMHIDEGVDHTSVPNSLLLMTPYPRVDQIVWIFGEESPLLPLFSIISKYRRLSRSRGSNESEEEGRKWTEDDAFRFSNDIGYRRYNSRSANPSIIVSVAITLPRLTII